MILKIVFPILFCMIFQGCISAQTKIEKIDRLVSINAGYGNFNGSILVVEQGKVIYKKAFGKADFDKNILNKTDTKFRLASVSKQFTAMLIMQLVAENKLNLNVPVTTYLPEYPAENGGKITIHHLLAHTSGLPNYTSFPNYRDIMGTPKSPGELVRLFSELALEFNPGENFSYSNSGYILLGYLIEKVTGKKYEQVLTEKIFDPLNMVNSGYDHNDALATNMASGFDKKLNSYVSASYLDMSVPFAAGALYSTVEDLALWDQALYTEKLLPKKYMDQMFKKQTPPNGPGYGYGWMTGARSVGNSGEKIESVSHGGSINGFNTIIVRIPSDKILITILNNTGEAPLNEMAQSILGILYDKPYDVPQRSLSAALLEVLESKGPDSALIFYNSNKSSKEYLMREDEMNTAGYQMLQNGKAKEAALLFRLNTEAYPNSFNTYDSYGEVLLVLGDTTASIENYKKSVKLNSENDGGIEVLKSLGVNTDDLIIKVSVAHLKLLSGEYKEEGKEWKIIIEEKDGQLYGNDGGYRYRLNPVGNDKFINPDDGATIEFNTENKHSLSFVIFGKTKLIKVK